MSGFSFEHRQLHAVEPELLELAQNGEVLASNMRRPKKQVHAGFHGATLICLAATRRGARNPRTKNVFFLIPWEP